MNTPAVIRTEQVASRIRWASDSAENPPNWRGKDHITQYSFPGGGELYITIYMSSPKLPSPNYSPILPQVYTCHVLGIENFLLGFLLGPTAQHNPGNSYVT